MAVNYFHVDPSYYGVLVCGFELYDYLLLHLLESKFASESILNEYTTL